MAGVRTVGRKLRVETLLEGSVRKSGERPRITVQLIDAETGFHRWSPRFDCRLDDLSDAEDEIASGVVACIGDGTFSANQKLVAPRAHTAAEA